MVIIVVLLHDPLDLWVDVFYVLLFDVYDIMGKMLFPFLEESIFI